MQEAWIELLCPACEERWEENPAELPEPDDSFTCKDCDETRPISEFARTARDFEVLSDFHEQ